MPCSIDFPTFLGHVQFQLLAIFAMYREEVGLLLSCLFTFVVILPWVCSDWPHSLYFSDNAKKDLEYELSLSTQIRVEESIMYFKNVSNWSRPLNSFNFKSALSLLIVVVSVERSGFYLTQVMAKLQHLMFEYATLFNYEVIICNVDKSRRVRQEINNLGHFYEVVDRHDVKADNVYEKEKQDYIFCINQSLHLDKSDYVLVLEDDALPNDDLFPVLSHLLRVRLQNKNSFFYLKLYHPERLQGFFQPEPWRIAEWFATASISAYIIVYLFFENVIKYFRLRQVKCFVYALAYFLFLYESMGRPYLLELRRLSPVLYNVLSVTECCTPAMLFPSPSINLVVQYLSSIHCREHFAKDTALYQHVHESKLNAYVIEPNLIAHIGLISSLPRT